MDMQTAETTYDFVVSLGYDCHCATMLRKCGLRSCSSPLDWLTAAPLETRLKLVETRFAGFLEKGNMRKLEKEPNAPGKGNDHYEDTATGLRFFHDFRETLPFDESYLQVKAKYDRRIARLYDNVEKSRMTVPLPNCAFVPRFPARTSGSSPFPRTMISDASKARSRRRCTDAPSGFAFLSAALLGHTLRVQAEARRVAGLKRNGVLNDHGGKKLRSALVAARCASPLTRRCF